MSKPIVAVVGRPNVGKSTFFNKIAGRKISIVENKPGVTRDRVYADAEWLNHKFTLIDTGGLELKSEDEMWKHIKKQADIAIETADVIIFMCDSKSGLTASDYDVAEILRHSRKPVVLAVNKLDNYDPSKLYEFYSLGLGEPFGISAEQSQGMGDLLDEVCASFKDAEAVSYDDDSVKIAIVGKPNAGKSSLANKLLGFERTIVSNIAGTTRDAIDTPVEYKGKKYTIIDTAGIRRKRSVDEDVEYYSVIRAFASVRRADVVLCVIDAEQGITEQDVKIIGYVHEQGKPSVIVMNKWDLIEKDSNTINKFNKKLSEDLAFMDYFKSIYISAKTGQRTEKIFSMVDEVLEHSRFRVTTGTLNDFISDCIRTTEPPTKNGRRLKIYYCVQDDVCPPTFIFFVNDEELMHFSYKRFLENSLRRAFDFSGTPIRLFVRKRDKEE
ncbi:MAG: ribosome biogenesis GTPase Der [Clostridia bacterium]|nr:ribosome biogenesis GTPase Der [Clostridia bacterium]